MTEMRSPRLACRHDQQRSEEHTSELQSPCKLVCRLLLEKKNKPNLENKHRYLSIEARATAALPTPSHTALGTTPAVSSITLSRTQSTSPVYTATPTSASS